MRARPRGREARLEMRVLLEEDQDRKLDCVDSVCPTFVYPHSYSPGS